VLDQARSANATIVRTLVDVVEDRADPAANAADPFDPAYRSHDIDELVRNAQQRGMEVLITIWGTPKWANGGKTPNSWPTKSATPDSVLARRRQPLLGRFAGVPVRALLLDMERVEPAALPRASVRRKGEVVARATTRSSRPLLYRGSRPATQWPRWPSEARRRQARDKPLAGKSATHSPGRFRAARRRRQPTPEVRRVGAASVSGAGQPEADPEGALAECDARVVPRFEKSLDTWFKRKNVRIWITEYGHETKQDGEPKGVLARPSRRLHDPGDRAREEGSAGRHVRLVHLPGRRDQRLAERLADEERCREARARPLPLGRQVRRRAEPARQGPRRIASPSVAVPLRELAANLRPGDTVGINYRIFLRGKQVATGQPATTLGLDAIARFRLAGFKPAKKTTYIVRLDANTANGGAASRELTIVAA
jgi:hypothetical protein